MTRSHDTITALQHAANEAPMLEREDEEQLIRELHAGSQVAMQKLLSSHLRLVMSYARRYTRSGIGLDDLVSEGNLGLVEAVRRFDPSRGTRFGTYAAWWVRAFVRRYAYANRRIVALPSTRNARRVIASLGKTQRALAADMGEAPTRDDVANALGVTSEDVEMVEVALGSRDVSVFPAEVDPFLADARFSPEDEVAAIEHADRSRAAVESALSGLTARERHILRRRILDDDTATLAALGNDMSLSRERIRQIEKRAQDKLRDALAEVA
jgi:RNA polymerase sigma-32 factor